MTRQSTFKDKLWRDLEQGSATLSSRRRRHVVMALVGGAIITLVAFVAVLPLGARNDEQLGVATKPLPTPIRPTDTADPTEPRPLGPASFIDDGSVVYDLRLSDGDRFRLSLPESLAEDFTVTEQPSSAPVLVDGSETSIEISFVFCEGRNDHAINALGSGTAIVGRSIRVCRADELIVMDVETATGVTPSDADHFDLRPITLGSRYGPVRTTGWPDFGACGNCAPHGPMTLFDQNIVVNTTGRSKVTALDLDSLEERWTFDTTRFTTRLFGADGGIIVGVEGGLLTKLDPATGGQLWEIPLESTDRDLGLSGHRDGIWVLRSSAVGEGQHWPGTIRRIDISTGEVLWTASGFKGLDWQRGRPILIDDVLVVAGISDFLPDGLGGLGGFFRGFDIETGEIIWTTDVEIVAAAFVPDALQVLDFESGPALLARTSDQDLMRIDPADGTVLWTLDSLHVMGLSGTEFGPDGTLALEAITPTGRVLLDPESGARVHDPEPDDASISQPAFVCPITIPTSPAFVPPTPRNPTPSVLDQWWFGTDDLWTVIRLDGGTGGVPMKSVWWSANFPGGSTEEMPALRVTYDRLDGKPETIVYEAPGTNASTYDDHSFMINGLTPSTPGCWLATATYKRAQLSIVIEVD